MHHIKGRAKDENDLTLTLSFVGDILITEDLQKANTGVSIEEKIRSAVPRRSGTERILMGNLEGPLIAAGPRIPGKFCIHSTPSAAEILKKSGFDLVSTANNHIMDFGVESMIRTLELLENAGIRYCGSGETSDAAIKPVIMEKNGIRVAFAAFVWHEVTEAVTTSGDYPGAAPMIESIVFDTLDEMRRISDIVVISLHWGFCELEYPHPGHVAFGRRLIDHGASIVVGHHPHVIQGIERYGGGLIAYSLGNFIFPDCEFNGMKHENTPANKTGLLLNVDFSKNGISGFEVVPIGMDETFNPFILDGKAKERTLDSLEELSTILSDSEYDDFYSRYYTEKRMTRYKYLDFGNLLKRIPGAVRDKGLSLELFRNALLIIVDLLRKFLVKLRIRIMGR